MPRPRKNHSPAALALPPALNSWAEAIGDAIGRGMVRALNNSGLGHVTAGPMIQARRRGRPPKVQPGQPVPADRMCKVNGCGRPSRSKGLCSAHYQAERRRSLAPGNGKGA
jgi:hypothetical protein